MNSTLIPTRSLTRTGNCRKDTAEQRRDVKLVFVLNNKTRTLQAEPRKADAESENRPTPLPKSEAAGDRISVFPKSLWELVNRPPERWGINE